MSNKVLYTAKTKINLNLYTLILLTDGIVVVEVVVVVDIVFVVASADVIASVIEFCEVDTAALAVVD